MAGGVMPPAVLHIQRALPAFLLPSPDKPKGRGGVAPTWQSRSDNVNKREMPVSLARATGIEDVVDVSIINLYYQ